MLDDGERRAVACLAGGPLPAADSAAGSFDRLRRLGVARADGDGSTRLASPLFERWLQRHPPEIAPG